MERKRFLRDSIKSLNPYSYKVLKERVPSHALKHALKAFLILFLISALLFTPKLISSKKAFDEELSKFTKLQISAKTEMLRPAMFPQDNPAVIIDTKNVIKETEGILITNNMTTIKLGPTEKSFKTADLGNILKQKENINSLFYWMLLLITPSLILAYFIFNISIIAIPMILLSFLGILFNKIFKLGHEIREITNISLFATIIPALMILLTLPFFIDIIWAALITYSLFFIITLFTSKRKEKETADFGFGS